MNIEEHAWIQAIALWVKAHLIGIVVLSAITLLASILSVLALIIYLPADYFTREKQIGIVANPILRILLRILKNIFGVIALIIGFVMMFGPGPGPLTILVGIILCDFPRKRRVERKLIGHPALLIAVNKIRARYKRPPILLNDE